MSKISSSTSGSGSTRSSRRNLETTHLILSTPKSYGSLLPYYEFVRSAIRADQAQQYVYHIEIVS
ncbi:hypothetical protein NQ317_011173 [Molorchus minor]|uniref:Uncharacterized protein n=1 Tax=Molorchus minor TaxID=1323400 RepID=A0ABQ9J0T5_9CUCU|nr:hypothetical protein NQ317_011173 [Molorchus minor]